MSISKTFSASEKNIMSSRVALSDVKGKIRLPFQLASMKND
jgi:hypothetical protein